ncbi:pseudouridine synthase [Xinfangfangia sp. D13-10-4-6]|uniref:pseudouridine synthase n=1 Tax=Pseudogemmobacter hezensis TaxID=2737662 RepID=UPI001554F8C7|nr:pseudouridine synthase [Pseudogemmobacter hezensis]NPD13651.1 pseudouridine synthase [Pseudogemmobacter hezensis]
MSEKTTPPGTRQDNSAPEGERIAKVLSRRGVASRREAERLIEAGEVSVNGKIITSPALNVTSADRITVSGRHLPEEEEARLWLYYKPEGLVTTASDEKGRDTVFDHLPEDMPRVMSVGRLDLNSEGLLLLTNDGGLKRRLELPSTGWLRKYRVRVNGRPEDQAFAPLREGITVDGERFKPMQVTLDRQQGANAWLTVGLREGRNREIRRAMNAIGFYVNRLIRVSYGPFRLGDLEPGQVEEVKARVLRDQLGEIEAEGEKSAGGRPVGTARARPALTRVRVGKPDSARAAGGKSPAGRPAGERTYSDSAGSRSSKFGAPKGRDDGAGSRSAGAPAKRSAGGSMSGAQAARSLRAAQSDERSAPRAATSRAKRGPSRGDAGNDFSRNRDADRESGRDTGRESGRGFGRGSAGAKPASGFTGASRPRNAAAGAGNADGASPRKPGPAKPRAPRKVSTRNAAPETAPGKPRSRPPRDKD